MMRNRKVWGVLGLLLALVLAVGVGYGQPQKPPTLKYVLTSVYTRETNNNLELFIEDLDVHPVRNLHYQRFEVPQGQTKMGVAFFYPKLGEDYRKGKIQLLIGSGFPADDYKYRACFRSAPGGTATINLTFSGQGVIAFQQLPYPPCWCDDFLAQPIPAMPGYKQVRWEFWFDGGSGEFCRVEVWTK